MRRRQSFEYENAEKNLSIEYEITDESFTHAFGSEKRTGHEITKIMALIPALDGWLDVSHVSEFQKPADDLMIDALENNEHGSREKDRADDLWFMEYKMRKAGLDE